MRRLFILLWFISVSVIGVTQEDTAIQSLDIVPSDFMMRVVVDSLNIRALPTTESERVGSLFEGDIVYAVGRNIDGTWYEVQRPSKTQHAGWVSRPFFSFMFDTTQLPITDLTTGVVGEDAVVDTNIASIILTEAVLRSEPNFNAQEIDRIPAQRIIPVLTRTPDNLWVKVNYLGQIGWVAEFLTNIPQGIGIVPVDESISSGLTALLIISPEVQRAQAQRFIDYATPIRDVAGTVASFWSQLSDGLTIPCNPPATNFTLLSVTQHDLYELPELRGANRLVPTAIDDLNTSIDMMRQCGIYTSTEIRSAYAKAINSRAILNNSIDTMNFVLENIIGS